MIFADNEIITLTFCSRMIQAVELKFSDDESEEESDMGKSDNQTFGMMAEDIGGEFVLALIAFFCHLSLITRKPVFGVFDQVRLNPACSATETS